MGQLKTAHIYHCLKGGSRLLVVSRARSLFLTTTFKIGRFSHRVLQRTARSSEVRTESELDSFGSLICTDLI